MSDDFLFSPWQRRFRRLIISFVYLGGALPLFWTSLFYFLFVRVGSVTDFSSESAQSAGLELHQYLVRVGIVYLPLVFVSWAVAAGGYSFVAPEVVPRRHFFILLGFWVAMLALVLIDPGGLFRRFFLSSD